MPDAAGEGAQRAPIAWHRKRFNARRWMVMALWPQEAVLGSSPPLGAAIRATAAKAIAGFGRKP